MAITSMGRTKASGRRHSHAKLPHGVSVLARDNEGGSVPDQPSAERAQDAMDPDLRHRMISEAAYLRYVERGYADGYDIDDWLQAEADVDHVLLTPARAEARQLSSTPLDETTEMGGQEGAPHSIAHDEAMKRIIKQHPQRDIPRVESLEPAKAPRKA